jgi:hypothetical protein
MTAAVMAAGIATPSQALTVLCLEDSSIGFNWTEEEWTPSKYPPESYIVKKLEASDPLGSACFDLMAHIGRSATPVKSEYSGSSSTSCYARYGVGSEPTMLDVEMCTEMWTDDGSLNAVYCQEGILAKFNFSPNGEFVIDRTFAVPRLSQKPERDSLVLAVGKCSVIEP